MVKMYNDSLQPSDEALRSSIKKKIDELDSHSDIVFLNFMMKHLSVFKGFFQAIREFQS
jgi:hypothetical protein